jgi:uncharacterized protein YqeY
MRARINEALKTAMKARDQVRVSTLRLMMAAIKEKDIEARTQDRCEGAGEQELLQLLQKMIKQREESSTTYEEAGRLDLAEQERREIEVIREFLPRQLGEAEIRKLCSEVVSEVGASGIKDMGKCMGVLKERYAGQMDFARASAEVRQMLS